MEIVQASIQVVRIKNTKFTSQLHESGLIQTFSENISQLVFCTHISEGNITI